MKTAAIGLLTGWAGLLLGQVATDTTGEVVPWIGGGVSLSALGVLSWTVWYLLAKYIPGRDSQNATSLNAQQETFIRTMVAQQTTFTAALDVICERHDRWEAQRHADGEQLEKALRELLVHCARTQAAAARNHAPPPALDCEGT